VTKLLKNLEEVYQKRLCALEVKFLNDGRVGLQLKPKFEKLVQQFNHRPLLTVGPLKTLSYIAFHQPVDQRQVINDRGSHVYAHLRMMEDIGLITRERTEERSYIIRTTSFFGDYFGFSHNPERSKLQLKKIFRDLKITKLENGSSDYGLDELGLDDIEEELADSGDRLSQGLPEYTSATNQGS
jgi:segregation and condensation protein B